MNLLCLNSDELIQKLRDENAENLRLRLKAEEDKRNAEDAKRKAEEDKRNAEEKHMKTIEAICQESPWRHLQFEKIKTTSSNKSGSSKSASAPTSPVMNGDKRKDFRKVCDRTCQVTQCKVSRNLRIAHMVPRKTALQCFADWKFDFTTHTHKNLLLVVNALEERYDKGEFCFLVKPLPGMDEEALAVKILNKSVIDEPIAGTDFKMRDLEGQFLDVRKHIPSHRCIAKHSFYSLAAAVSKGWMELPEYHALVAQIHFQSPEKAAMDRVREWLQTNQGTMSISVTTISMIIVAISMITVKSRRMPRDPNRVIGPATGPDFPPPPQSGPLLTRLAPFPSTESADSLQSIPLRAGGASTRTGAAQPEAAAGAFRAASPSESSAPGASADSEGVKRRCAFSPGDPRVHRRADAGGGAGLAAAAAEARRRPGDPDPARDAGPA